MKIESIKNVNITLLFSGPINHLLVSQQDLFGLFKTSDIEKDKHTFIEAPGLKVFILPTQQKEIIFEANRILVNNKTGKNPENNELIVDLQKLLGTNLLEKDKVVAYGFNYDVIATPSSGNFNVKDLIGEKILANIAGIKKADININFEQKGIKYTVGLNPLDENGQKFLIHLNAHFDILKLPDFEVFKKNFVEEYKNLEEITQKL